MRTSLLLLSALFLILASCSGGGEHTDASEEGAQALPEVLQRGTMTLDLTEYFLPFALYVPDSTYGIPVVEETSYGEVNVQVGKTYHVVIAEGGNLEMKKAELASDLLYTHEMVEEGDDYMLYKSTIKDSYLEPEYHFYAVKKVGDRTYEFHDFNEDGGYAQSVASFMLASVNHLVSKEKGQSS